MDEGQERGGELVISCGNAPELLETAEEPLDQVAVPIEMGVERALIFPVGAWRDNGLSALGPDGRDKRIGIVTLVRNHRLGGDSLDQRRGAFDVRNLARRQDDAQRIAQGIDCNMQLGGQPAARPADLLGARFFWAPAEC